MSCKSQKCDIFILINFSFDGCIVVGLTPSLVSTSLLVFFFFHCCSHGYTPTWSKSQLKHKIRRFKAILRLVFWSISSLCANAAALCPLSVPLIVIVPLKDYIILFAPFPPPPLQQFCRRSAFSAQRQLVNSLLCHTATSWSTEPGQGGSVSRPPLPCSADHEVAPPGSDKLLHCHDFSC